MTLKKNLPISLYLLLPLLLHAPIWLGSVDFYTGEASDLIPYVYGLKSLIYNTARDAGELPLWNPYILLGQPTVGNIQYALFYPLGILFVLFSFFKALWINQVIHMAIAGYGAYRLAGFAGCGHKGSLVSGLLYMFNGRLLYYIHAGWVGYFYSICWLPLLILVSLKVLQEEDLKYPVYYGLVFAMSLLCGTPQYAFMGYCLFLLQGGWVICFSGGGLQKLALLSRILLSGVMAILLIAVQLFPSAEQAYLSTRQFANPAMSGFHFDWSLPQWFRVLIRPEFLPQDFSWELCIYMGAGGFILALPGLYRLRRQLSFLLVWGVVPMLLSMGAAFPLLDRLIGSLPGIGMLTNPSRYLIFAAIVLCVAAGFGLEALLARGGQSKKVRFAITGSLGVILAAGLVIPPAAPVDTMTNIRLIISLTGFAALSGLYWLRRQSSWKSWLLIGWLVAEPLFIVAPAVLNGYRSVDIQPPQKIIQGLKQFPGPARVAFFQPPNLRDNLVSPLEDWVFTRNRIGRAGGYEPLALQRTLNFLCKMDATDVSISDSFWGFRLFGLGRPRLFNLAGISHILSTEPLAISHLKLVNTAPMTAPDFHGGRWQAQRIFLYENVSVLGPALFMPDNHVGVAYPVALKIDSPNHRQLILDFDVPGTVFLSESFHTGWIALEQGRPLVIQPFMDTFISFQVAAGRHAVDLEFRPKSLQIGMWLTVAGVMLGLCLLSYSGYIRLKGLRSRR